MYCKFSALQVVNVIYILLFEITALNITVCYSRQ